MKSSVRVRLVTAAMAAWILGGAGVAPARAQDQAPAPAGQETTMAGNVDPMAAIDAFIKEKAVDTTRSGWRTSLPKPPKVSFDPAKSYFWVLETNHGKIKIKLLPQVALPLRRPYLGRRVMMN